MMDGWDCGCKIVLERSAKHSVRRSKAAVCSHLSRIMFFFVYSEMTDVNNTYCVGTAHCYVV